MKWPSNDAGQPTERRSSARGGLNKVSDLNLEPLWLTPDHTVATARHVMDGHRVGAIGVLENGRLAGFVSYAQLAGRPDSEKLGRALAAPKTMLSSDTPLREAAMVLVRENAEFVPIVDEGRFVGIVTATMLLREMSRTWDPLTELPWSDRLREWGVDRLEAGDELTILFIDLDDFGLYNKRHGHIVGDRVLQLVAARIRDATDPLRDVLVRYGGDEFAIGTVRRRGEAEDLASTILAKVQGGLVAGAEEPVQISIGLYGGRRTTERENVHYSSTLDSLINLASKDCMARKADRREVKDRQPAPEPPAALPIESSAPTFDSRPSLVEVMVDEESDRGIAMVTIETSGQLWRGVSARSASSSAADSVSQAALGAVERMMGGTRLTIEGLAVESVLDGWTASVHGRRQDDGAAAIPKAGEARGPDKMSTVVEAVLEAFCR